MANVDKNFPQSRKFGHNFNHCKSCLTSVCNKLLAVYCCCCGLVTFRIFCCFNLAESPQSGKCPRNYGTNFMNTNTANSKPTHYNGQLSIGTTTGAQCSHSVIIDLDICCEQTPLLNGTRHAHFRKGIHKSSIRIDWGLISLAIFLFGGGGIGTYLLIEEDRFQEILSFELIERSQWSAEISPHASKLNNSIVNHVIIFTTNSFECHTMDTCIRRIELIQDEFNKSGEDIPYNFLIGGDGRTYEVRGWTYESGFNQIQKNISLTIGLIGNFSILPPSQKQINEVQALIVESISRRKLLSNYRIYGVRNLTKSVSDTDGIFALMSEWQNWVSILSFV